MKSKLPKVAHTILGIPMVAYVVRAADEAGCERIVVVTGHGAQLVETLVTGVTTVRQAEQLGTGHAAMCAERALGDLTGSLVVLSGDSPLLRPATIAALIEERERSGAAAVVLTARLADPAGYGRILRDDDGALAAIVEDKDLAPDQHGIDEVNTGTYCFDAAELFSRLKRLGNGNAQGEYYLTDMIGMLRAEGLPVRAMTTTDPSETLGVNSRVQLAEAARVMQRRINRAHMLAGVTMTDPDLVWIAPTVRIGRDTVVEPLSFLLGETTVGEDCVIGPDTRLTDCTVGDGCVVDSSVAIESRLADHVNVGPRSYLRPGTRLLDSAKVGTSVEIKNSTIGEGSKVPHLSYMGDATVGKGVNIGAGTITCNYDGERKNPTVIGDGAFIGSDTMLIAPVTVGEGAVIGAGSAIARDVPADALALERTEQHTIEQWARRRRARRDGTTDMKER